MRMRLLLFAVMIIGMAAQMSNGHSLVRQLSGLRGVSARLRQNADGLIPPIQLDEFVPISDTSRAHPHPHGDKVCASGCALSRHPTERLSKQRFEELLVHITSDPADQAALDELLYFGPQALARLKAAECRAIRQLPGAVHSMLLHELKKSHGTVSLRLISESGDVLAELPEQHVPLDLRHEFDLQEHGIPTLLASGTIKRVGQHRLWSRL